jgi:hypothetical protein
VPLKLLLVVTATGVGTFVEATIISTATTTIRCEAVVGVVVDPRRPAFSAALAAAVRTPAVRTAAASTDDAAPLSGGGRG